MEAGVGGDWDALELQQDYSIEDIALEALVDDWDHLVHADPTLDDADDEQHSADDEHPDASDSSLPGGAVCGEVTMHRGGAVDVYLGDAGGVRLNSTTDVQHTTMQCGAADAQAQLGPSQPRDVAGEHGVQPAPPTASRMGGSSRTQSLLHVRSTYIANSVRYADSTVAVPLSRQLALQTLSCLLELATIAQPVALRCAAPAAHALDALNALDALDVLHDALYALEALDVLHVKNTRGNQI
ncbi:hypothetical protein PHYSODRAFT_307715 [Phytophthora sojae]|uniref:Uncharacterized protein n=1 Tax=Phytophthora sojae (strain P6497) TaxID=1094619 RepID=G5AFR1_PHYSP|nr:hypothetical protein PHYSODRAFT_307715 [Phytophthora sojae]EGZ05427.1 hypothetical protein PHYSODRAFT_307715 [Phytophthora sojae]|eukprot:XP_009538958.1 hypothetical protein PHYSODRAFT_307715 [Phytophthora sojae]